MNSLEIIALLILILVLGGNFITSKKTRTFKLQKIALFLFSAIFVYPFFIQGVFLFNNKFYVSSEAYPEILFSLADENKYSIFGFNRERNVFFIQDFYLQDYIDNTLVYLVIVVSVFAIIFKGAFLKQFFTKTVGGKQPINFKGLLISTLFLTYLIKPIYTSVVDPTYVETEECRRENQRYSFGFNFSYDPPCKNGKAPARLISYFNLVGDAGVITYKPYNLGISFLLALILSFFTQKFRPTILASYSKTLKNGNTKNVEVKIRVLKEMLEAGAITEEEYKDEMKKLKDQFI